MPKNTVQFSRPLLKTGLLDSELSTLIMPEVTAPAKIIKGGGELLRQSDRMLGEGYLAMMLHRIQEGGGSVTMLLVASCYRH